MLALLERAVLANGHLDEVVERALVERHVRHAVDEDGCYAWVPVDAARMRLEDRVASLFAADYMNDAPAYRDLYVCHHCEAVVFDADARERGMCSAHRTISVVVPKNPSHLAKRTLAYGG